EDHGQGGRPVKAPSEHSGSGFGLPRNVLSERERRKRISVSCERLRALLPQFDGRREDMASVLEMAVQFLRLAGTLVPSQEPHAVLGPSKEMWREWQRDVTPLAFPCPSAAGPPDGGTGACGLSVLVSPGWLGSPRGQQTQTVQGSPSAFVSPRPQAPPSCMTTGAGEDEAPSGTAEMLEGL
ncbi:hypothetical protein PANDA_014071, partial [Ailuropoda melanoleuca]